MFAAMVLAVRFNMLNVVNLRFIRMSHLGKETSTPTQTDNHKPIV